jgi:hypothetical protein
MLRSHRLGTIRITYIVLYIVVFDLFPLPYITYTTGMPQLKKSLSKINELKLLFIISFLFLCIVSLGEFSRTH